MINICTDEEVLTEAEEDLVENKERSFIYISRASYKYQEVTKFPEISEIYSSKSVSADDYEIMPDFISAVNNSVSQVFIIDEYLFKPYSKDLDKQKLNAYFNKIFSIFLSSPELKKVKIISNINFLSKANALISKIEFKKIVDEINKVRIQNNKPELDFQIKNMPNYIHDRFVIIDDELWHFGASVGGLHNKLNAASRGWCAKKTKANEIFKQIWNDCGDPL